VAGSTLRLSLIEPTPYIRESDNTIHLFSWHRAIPWPAPCWAQPTSRRHAHMHDLAVTQCSGLDAPDAAAD
jgi:hypothetical protein